MESGALRQALRIALLLMVAGSSWWLLELATQEPTEPAPQGERVTDGYLRGFTMTLMDEAGRPRQYLTGITMYHYPDTQTAEIDQPRLTVIDENMKSWDVQSERGLIPDHQNKVIFAGDVLITRVEQQPAPPLRIRTQDLEVDTQVRVAHTARAVAIEHRGGVTKGVGMRASLKDGRVSLLADVEGAYEPEPR